jgi:hypothetical protein
VRLCKIVIQNAMSNVVSAKEAHQKCSRETSRQIKTAEPRPPKQSWWVV